MPEQDIFENEVEVVADIPQTAEVKQYAGSISIGDVVTLPPGTDATVTNTGTSENAIFNFGIPRGAAGTLWGSITGDINDQTDLMAIISSLQSRIVSLENSLPEVGSISTSVKSSLAGHLLCNGQAVSRVTYAALFAVIGTGFGPGDGTSTFNVPDYRGCFLRGLGGQSAVDIYTKQNSGSPNITGGFTSYKGGYGGGGYATGAFSISADGNVLGHVANEGGASTHFAIDASRSSTVYQNGLSEVRPTNHAVNFFIKY